MRFVPLAVLAFVLVVANGLIVDKERVIDNGRTAYLRIAPRDPRSLIQGDYMRLAYSMTRRVDASGLPDKGELVIALDEDRVARYVRVDDGTPLGNGELLLRYRRKGQEVRVGAETFFFQEGMADEYQRARYAELRVAPSGKSVLVGLRDDKFEPLGERSD